MSVIFSAPFYRRIRAIVSMRRGVKQKRLQLPTKFSDVVVGLANPDWQTVESAVKSSSVARCGHNYTVIHACEFVLANCS